MPAEGLLTLMYDDSRELSRLGVGERAPRCGTARLRRTVDRVAGVAPARTPIGSKEEKEVVRLLGLLTVAARGSLVLELQRALLIGLREL